MATDDNSLEAGDVHVWRARLDPAASEVAACWSLLSADERARAERYRFERHRRRFVVARGTLRKLLGRYTARPPADIVFRVTEYGKPVLDGGEGLQFNLSHSHELAVYAFAALPVGVDVEHLRPVEDALDIAARFFSPREVADLRALGEDRRARAFFACWTRKEAYIKALGQGLSLPLDSFSVSLELERPALRHAGGDPEEWRRWTIANVEVGEGYAGAVAVRGRFRGLVYPPPAG